MAIYGTDEHVQDNLPITEKTSNVWLWWLALASNFTRAIKGWQSTIPRDKHKSELHALHMGSHGCTWIWKREHSRGQRESNALVLFIRSLLVWRWAAWNRHETTCQGIYQHYNIKRQYLKEDHDSAHQPRTYVQCTLPSAKLTRRWWSWKS